MLWRSEETIGIAIALALIGGPLLLGMTGLVRAHLAAANSVLDSGRHGIGG